MNKAIIIGLVLSITYNLSAQSIKHNLIFKPNQIELTEEQKTEIYKLSLNSEEK